MTSDRPLISVRELTKTYRIGGDGHAADGEVMEVRALRGVTLEVMPAEFIALTGPSGSGKSTFMHLLGCLDRPTSGDYFLSGENVSKLDKRALARVRNREIGFVFQGFNLLPRTSALENVELPLLYDARPHPPAERHRRAQALLDAVGIGQRANHTPNQLSGGQQQRVAIARALVNEPEILLADEPTGNLDSTTSAEILELLRQSVSDYGQTTVMVTHDANAAAIADRILFLADGCIVKELRGATPHEIHAAIEEVNRR
jgi:putative ABC transport system ATP-binding protein